MIVGRQRRELARWEATTRAWAADTGRHLAITLHRGEPPPVRPCDVGLVLWDNETVWAELPARCSADTPLPLEHVPARQRDRSPQPRITDWLITNFRVAGRLYPDILRWWQWSQVVGMKANLASGQEYVQLDLPLSSDPVRWWGAGVAPLAVAAVYCLHGTDALLDHPGLLPLRQQPTIATTLLTELEPPQTTLRDLGI